MLIEQYYGVHATCMEYAPIIKKMGFNLSSPDRYLGAAVYFFEKSESNIEVVNFYKDTKLQKGHCKYGDEGVVITAKIESFDDYVIDLDDEFHTEALEEISTRFWEEYDYRYDVTRREKLTKLNRRRNAYVLSLIPDLRKRIDFVKASLPYRKKNYSRGFVVYNTTCISEISYDGRGL